MARLFDFIEPAQALALEARVEEAERELIQLRAATAAMEAFRVAIGDHPVNSNADGGVISSNFPNHLVHATDQDAEESLVDGTRESVEFTKSVSVEGRDDVRDTHADADDGLSL
jgi:hypothetical protein